MITPFTKPGCNCNGCTRYGEHEEGYTGWHYITLTTGAGRAVVECRCGMRSTHHSEAAAGPYIAAHRLAEGLLA